MQLQMLVGQKIEQDKERTKAKNIGRTKEKTFKD